MKVTVVTFHDKDGNILDIRVYHNTVIAHREATAHKKANDYIHHFKRHTKEVL